jgi:Domain of unknown function (DUF6265)
MKPLWLLLAAIAAAALPGAYLRAAPIAKPSSASSQNKPIGRSPAPAQTVELTDFSWLAGTWQGTWGPRTVEQAWTFPASAAMSGTMQITERGKSFVTEIFVVLQDDSSIELKTRHFTANLTPWEKTEPSVLTFSSEDKDGLAFVNSSGGEPKRIVFKRLDADHYVFRSEVAPGEDNAQITEIVFHRLRQAPLANRKSGL